MTIRLESDFENISMTYDELFVIISATEQLLARVRKDRKRYRELLTLDRELSNTEDLLEETLKKLEKLKP